MELSWYQKGHPPASTVLLNNNSFWRCWEVKGQKVRSTQSGCGTSNYPSDFTSHEGSKISFSPGYRILSSALLTGFPLTCRCCSCALADPTYISALFCSAQCLSVSEEMGRQPYRLITVLSPTGWSLSSALHHYSAKGNIQLELACLWRKGRWRGWWAWSRGSPRVQHCLCFPGTNAVW